MRRHHAHRRPADAPPRLRERSARRGRGPRASGARARRRDGGRLGGGRARQRHEPPTRNLERGRAGRSPGGAHARPWGAAVRGQVRRGGALRRRGPGAGGLGVRARGDARPTPRPRPGSRRTAIRPLQSALLVRAPGRALAPLAANHPPPSLPRLRLLKESPTPQLGDPLSFLKAVTKAPGAVRGGAVWERSASGSPSLRPGGGGAGVAPGLASSSRGKKRSGGFKPEKAFLGG